MMETRRPQLSSVFDDMAARNRKRLDELYRGGRGQTAATSPIAKDALGRQWNETVWSAATSVADLNPDSPLSRRLRERFGNDWRFEITERLRVGDEAIVLGRLTVGKDSIRTQFGRATMSPAPVAGASGDVKFKMAADGGETDESEAFRLAAEAALSGCADLI
jgi:hypothetical protein